VPAQPPSVVVGIATHNRAPVLPKAIRSALTQSYRPLRVAVIDDASTDDTPTIRERFPTVAWTRWQANRGHLAARNKMMLEAGDKYFVSLDDDAWFLRGDEIALAVDFLERNPGTAAIAFDILSPDRPEPTARGPCIAVPAFVGCGHVLRLSVVRKIGGYIPFPGTYGAEERDLCLQLIDSGHAIVQLVGVHVWHDKSDLARDVSRQHRSGVCNDLAFAVRRVPLYLLPPTLVWKFAAHFIFALRKGLLRPALQGMGQFLGAWAGIWRARRPVRRASIRIFRSLTKAPREFT
jgi:glycosyltransferase involved in cell wall biosynthesis